MICMVCSNFDNVIVIYNGALNQAEIPYMEKTAIMEILDKKISNAAKLTQLTAMHPEEGIVGAVGEILTAIE